MKYLMVILVGLAGVGFFTYNIASIKGELVKNPYQESANESITVPNVKGMSTKEAKTKLEKVGFKVNEKYKNVSSDEIEEGKVVKTAPIEGAKRTKGTEVTIYVSKNNDYVVEDFVEEKTNYLTAQGKLEAYGIYVIIKKKDVEDKDKYTDGQVIEQSIKPGEKLKAKDTIILYIPNIVTEYPNFLEGFTVEEVENFCNQYNIELKVERVPNSEVAEGTIFYQSKPEGYTIASGGTLTIRVATKGEKVDCNPLNEVCE